VANVKGARKYSSAVRDEQAALTRSRILEAASELFLQHGYARTTMQDIAERAGVARDTVHAAMGTKAQLLTALVDRRLVPDDSVANVTHRPEAQAIKNEADQRKQIELFAEFITRVSARIRPIAEVLRTASAVEPEMAQVADEMDRYRMKNMQTYAAWMARRGPLRVGRKRAGEIMFTLASPDVGRMVCDKLGWSQAEHARWLADSLIRTLLPDDAGDAPR
jgi:AcrR family transcriptional regulator